MRFLNKIVFIHSAHIQYAEINLDGNVHFIGTQGVGKSTLLRAILFFYNADTQSLGIPREKKGYADYYFPFPNSYVVYEVARDEERFCVVTYKSQNRICFRFIDGAYQQGFFVDANGAVAEQWERIAGRLDTQRIFYSKRKIEQYAEYRDILYGNQDGKKSEFKRYALMESKEYGNIPKTIQNVFLNSKMEADFIKQTIISSLENDVMIDLTTYNRHLKGFDTQLADIQKFNELKTREQAHAITGHYNMILYLEREKVGLAQALGAAFAALQDAHPLLAKQLGERQADEMQVKERLARLADEGKKAEEKFNKDVGAIEAKLKTARELAKKYEDAKIDAVLSRVAQKPIHEGTLGNLKGEQQSLVLQQQALAQSFQLQLDAVDNQLGEYVNRMQQALLKLEQELMQAQEQVRQRVAQLASELREAQQQAMGQARETLDLRRGERMGLQHQRDGLEKQRFLQDEIEGLRDAQRKLEDAQRQFQAERNEAQRNLDALLQKLEWEEKELQKANDAQWETLQAQIVAQQAQIISIEGYLENSKTSLYGWLATEYPGWENTIGKVIDADAILFHNDLSPRKLPESLGLYGVEIDLEQVQKTVKTVEDYAYERQGLLDRNRQLALESEAVQTAGIEAKENLRKRFHVRIKECKDLVHERNYQLEQNRRLQDEGKVKLEETVRRAAAEKDRAILALEQSLRAAVEVEQAADGTVRELAADLEKQLRAVLRERDQQLAAEGTVCAAQKADIEAAIVAEKLNFAARKQAIEANKSQELKAQGVDTQRLQFVEQEIQALTRELAEIDGLRVLVIEYEKDKREVLNQVGAFKARKQALEQQLEQERDRRARLMDKVRTELGKVQALITGIAEKLKEIAEDELAMTEFQATDLYASLEAHIVSSDAHKTSLRVTQLIVQLRDVEYGKLRRRTDELTKAVVDFLGKFSEGNIFQFNRQVGDLASYLAFAQMLSDFVEEKKIERIEKEVNERFAYIISTIGKETSGMMAETGKIQTVVRRINDDFAAKNFVGAIKRIELRVDPSKNEIVGLLLAIKQFNDTNGLELGAANLFSSNNQDRKNKEAVDLLKQFHRKIGEQRRDQISLADSFELRFRIEENLNDTGWVEKLSNVGSEGTDVLVKAMLNIMLLNVFKEGASRRFKDFKLHCMMDEIGKLHPTNVRGILQFGNERNIFLINSSPIENDALAFRYIYKLHKDAQSITKIHRILTQDIAG